MPARWAHACALTPSAAAVGTITQDGARNVTWLWTRGIDGSIAFQEGSMLELTHAEVIDSIRTTPPETETLEATEHTAP